MQTEHADTIVLGLGAMGSAAIYHLARRGERVIGIDQFDGAHALGSSHGYSRAIRLCYYEHPDYVPLLKRAYELWDDLEKESGAKLLHFTGGLYMGHPASASVNGAIRAAREYDLPHEVLSHAAIAARYPQFRLPGDFQALYEPAAGYLLPERVIGTHLGLAQRHGAAIRAGERVESWHADASGVQVHTGREVIRGKRLIIAAGAWAEKLVGHPSMKVTPTRQVQGWVMPRRPELFAMGRFPMWAIDVAGEALYYGFPIAPEADGGPPGLKLARHVRGPVVDADRIDRAITAAEEEEFRPVLRRFIPEADGPVVTTRLCMYENSPDSHFILDRHPEHGNVLLAAGFSGHGFKFASVVGERLAEAAVRDDAGGLPGFLRASRFGEAATAGNPNTVR